MAQDRRERHRIPLITHDQVRVADTGRLDGDEDLSRLRVCELHFLDGERSSLGFRHCRLGLQAPPLLSRTSGAYGIRATSQMLPQHGPSGAALTIDDAEEGT